MRKLPPGAALAISLTVLLALCAAPALLAENSRNAAVQAPSIGAAVEAARPLPGALVPKQDGCVEHTIACGQTLTGQITSNDCGTDPPDPIHFDIWIFAASVGQTITATLTSNDFDPFLILFDPDVNNVAEDDNSGPGNAARIVHQIDETSSDWALTPTPLEANVTGSYTLSLQCSGNNPPPPTDCPTGFFEDPGYPDFCFRVEIGNPGSALAGTREPDCIDETVCVSGALPGRSEVFLRVIGPRPNGFLWPTIVRFTPSRVEVFMHQLSSGDTQNYVLGAIPPGVDELSGLQDRTGFLP